MALHRLLFDTTDATSIEQSANVGAFIRMSENGKLVSYTNNTEAGSISLSFVPGDVTVGTDSISSTAHGLETGDIVQVSSDDTLPTGLSAATDYFVIRVDADTIQLAASLEDAEAGSPVTITAAGAGNHSAVEQERERNAMDVNVVNDISATIAGSVEVTATDLDIRDLVFATDKVDVSGSEVSLDAASLAALETVTVEQGTSPWVVSANGGSFVVTATDLDIRDLTHVSDSIALGDGTDLYTSTTVGADIGLDVNLINANIEVTQGTSPWVIGDGGGSITVDAVDLDIRDLSSASDSVAAFLNDGAGNSISSTSGSLDVNVTNSIDIDDGLANTAIASAANPLGSANTAEDLVASPLASRKYLFAYNNGNKVAYIGASGVSAATGFPIFPGGILEMRAGAAVDIEWVSSDTNQEMRTLELS